MINVKIHTTFSNFDLFDQALLLINHCKIIIIVTITNNMIAVINSTKYMMRLAINVSLKVMIKNKLLC